MHRLRSRELPLMPRVVRVPGGVGSDNFGYAVCLQQSMFNLARRTPQTRRRS